MRLLVILLLHLASRLSRSCDICVDSPPGDSVFDEHVQKLKFYIMPDTVKVAQSTLEAALVNNENTDSFNFKLVGLKDDTFRIKVSDSVKKRFSADVALDGTPKEQSVKVVRSNDELIMLEAGNNSVVLRYNPFLLEVTRDNVTVIQINRYSEMFISRRSHKLAMDVTFPLAKRIYGIPEHADRLSLKFTSSNKPYRLFNSGTYGFATESRKALYGSVPVLYGIGKPTTGTFWMNSAETFVYIDDVGGIRSVFISESGSIDFFVFTGPSLKDSVRQYTTLTGVTPIPQYFALGYHQSRYSYETQAEVENVVAEFDRNEFPIDVIWLDIDYTDGYKYFTWNFTAFPNPAQMQRNLLYNNGRRIVVVIDPHIKVENGYRVYDEGKANGYFVKNPNGTDFVGMCWPGMSSYIDFFNPKAAEWYSNLHLPKSWFGTTSSLYIWNDMNEPSVFNTKEKTMNGNLIHYGGWLHKDVHNLYGLKQSKATFNGLMLRDPNKRPFVLSRSHFAGSQRYATSWTGDNNPSWEHLKISISMLLAESLAGLAFCGCDVGGFTGNVGNELLQRWYQVGAWYPFFRSHSGKTAKRGEPYVYPLVIKENIRASLRKRYAHLPYWYTLWFQHQKDGYPLMRSLSYQFPDDINTLDIDDQFLIGSSILICPVVEEHAQTKKCYIPKGADSEWIETEEEGSFYGGVVTLNVTLDSTPIFYKAGHIVVTQNNAAPSSEVGKGYPYTINVFCGTKRNAIGYLYIDDYESYEYLKGLYAYYRIYYDCVSNSLNVNNLNKSPFITRIFVEQVIVWKTSKEQKMKHGQKAIKYAHKVVLKSTDIMDFTINFR